MSESKLIRQLQTVRTAKDFKLTYTYARGTDRGISSLLAEATAIEDLVMSNANVLTVIEGNMETLSITYSQDFNHIIAGYTDSAIRKYKAQSAELVQTFRDDELERNPAPVTNIKHKPTSKNYPTADTIVATYANGLIKCWNHDFGTCIYTIKEKRQTYGITFHPKLIKFVTYGDDAKLYMYDEETRLQERVFSGSHSPGLLDGHTSRIFACCFHPSNQFELMSGGWDNVVFFWDMRQPFAIRTISGVHITGDGIDVNATGTEVMTCAWQNDNPLQLWDYRSGKLIQNIAPDPFTSKLYCGKYVTKDYAVCGGAEPNLIRVVDMKGFGTIASVNKLPGAVYAVDDCPVRKVKSERRSSITGVKRRESIIEDDRPKLVISCCKRIYQLEIS